jgi:hypothetical protein
MRDFQSREWSLEYLFAGISIFNCGASFTPLTTGSDPVVFNKSDCCH